MKKLRYATQRFDKIRTTGTASKYIAHVDDLKPGPVVLYLRVSTPMQERKGHLKHQDADLQWELERRGFEVIAVFRETVSGHAKYRMKLEFAALTAKEAGAVVVAESTWRFIRSSRFKTNRRILPSVWEFEKLMALVDGAKLATFVHPDAAEDEVRGHESKRGQIGNRNRGGRPTPAVSTKDRRKSKLPQALRLRRRGQGYGTIGKVLGVPRSTIRDWIKRYGGRRAERKNRTPARQSRATRKVLGRKQVTRR